MPLWVEWLKAGLLVGAAVFGVLKTLDAWRRGQILEEARLLARIETTEEIARSAADQHDVWRIAMVDMDKRIVEVERRVGEKDRRHPKGSE